MHDNFKPCLAFVRHWEGGNDDDPDDPGGRTSRGITQAEYSAWCELHATSSGDVWEASDETIDEIYYKSYWLPYGDVMPTGLDLVFFDTGVNEGPREAVLFLQRAMGVNADGHFGMVTAAALRRMSTNPKDVAYLITHMTVQREAEYRRLRKFKKYGRGWLARAVACQVAGQEMVK
jgi:lysozyme family protein